MVRKINREIRYKYFFKKSVKKSTRYNPVKSGAVLFHLRKWKAPNSTPKTDRWSFFLSQPFPLALVKKNETKTTTTTTTTTTKKFDFQFFFLRPLFVLSCWGFRSYTLCFRSFSVEKIGATLAKEKKRERQMDRRGPDENEKKNKSRRTTSWRNEKNNKQTSKTRARRCRADVGPADLEKINSIGNEWKVKRPTGGRCNTKKTRTKKLGTTR